MVADEHREQNSRRDYEGVTVADVAPRPVARRPKYRADLTRSNAAGGCIGGRMQPAFHHGLLT